MSRSKDSTHADRKFRHKRTDVVMTAEDIYKTRDDNLLEGFTKRLVERGSWEEVK